MESLTLKSPEISCDHCRHTIEREVNSIGGVHSVSVDVPAQRIDVTYDGQQTSASAIIDRLDEEGYPVGA